MHFERIKKGEIKSVLATNGRSIQFFSLSKIGKLDNLCAVSCLVFCFDYFIKKYVHQVKLVEDYFADRA
jgi:hypothetical protein